MTLSVSAISAVVALQSTDWVVFNTSQQLELMRVNCGGWHRPFAHSCPNPASLLFIHHQPRDQITHVHRRELQQSQRSRENQSGEPCGTFFLPTRSFHSIYSPPGTPSVHPSVFGVSHSNIREAQETCQASRVVLVSCPSQVSRSSPAMRKNHPICAELRHAQANSQVNHVFVPRQHPMVLSLTSFLPVRQLAKRPDHPYAKQYSGPCSRGQATVDLTTTQQSQSVYIRVYPRLCQTDLCLLSLLIIININGSIDDSVVAFVIITCESIIVDRRL